MIPETAVEAAAERDYGPGWASASEWERLAYLAHATNLLEAAAPHMGARATVGSIEELDALPRFSVIRSDEGCVFERQTMWHEAGSRDLMNSPDIALPATVLQVGWGEE